MPGTVRLSSFIACAAVFTFAPAALTAQEAGAQRDPSSCPAEVMTDWGIIASMLLPYGMAEQGMSHGMMEPEMPAGGLSIGMPDGGLMMEVMQFQPSRVLGLDKQLALSPDQIDGIKRLIAEHWDAEESLQGTMEAGIKELQEAVAATEPDTAVVRREALQLAQERDPLFAELVVNSAETRMMLTEQQREQIRNGPCALHHMPTMMGGPGRGRP